MILFFGTRLRRRAIGSGLFPCPYCFTERQYEVTESRTWAHLFWVPLFPLGSARESVRCTVCGNEWATEVLVGRQAFAEGRRTAGALGIRVVDLLAEATSELLAAELVTDLRSRRDETRQTRAAPDAGPTVRLSVA